MLACQKCRDSQQVCVRARVCVCVCVCVYVCSIHLCVYEVYDVPLIIDNENLLH